MKKALIVCISIGFMMGCSSTSSRLNTALMPARNIGDSVGCSGGCKDEWTRAQFWIAKHSMMKIQILNEVLIDTYNPIGQKVVYGFTVTKEPIGNDNHVISMDLRCGNILGCSPKPEDVRSAFYYYIKYGKDLLDGQGYMSSIR